MLLRKILNLKTGIEYFLAKRDFLLTVMIGLTYFCQCKCPHCGISIYKKNEKDEITTPEWINFIKKLKRNMIRRVYFFGGEPLIRNDILKLISQAHNKGFRTALDTNGYFLNEELVQKLKEAGLDHIGVSIDSPNPMVHNNLRGITNLFEKAIKGIKYCKQVKIKCAISTYATKEKIKNGDLEKLINLAKKIKVDYVRILSPIATGKWLNKEDIKLNFLEKKFLNKLRLKNLGFVQLEDSFCLSLHKRMVYVSPYGEIQPCWSVPFSFGNIRQDKFEDIIKRMWSHDFFKKQKKVCFMNNEQIQKEFRNKLKTSSTFPINF